MKKIQLLIADDHVLFLEGLQSLLSNTEDMEVLAVARNGMEAMELLKQHQPDIVITDISMPDMDGILLNNAIKKQYPGIKTLVLSTYSENDKIRKLTDQKVNGYLLKNAENEELLRAIYSIHGGVNYFSKEIIEVFNQHAFHSNAQHAPLAKLSKREKEVLWYITKEHTSAKIAQLLNIEESTVSSHRKNLMSKLGKTNTAGLVNYANENPSEITDPSLDKK